MGYQINEAVKMVTFDDQLHVAFIGWVPENLEWGVLAVNTNGDSSDIEWGQINKILDKLNGR